MVAYFVKRSTIIIEYNEKVDPLCHFHIVSYSNHSTKINYELCFKSSTRGTRGYISLSKIIIIVF